MGQRFPSTLLFLLVCICNASFGFTFTCKEAERKALLQIKHGFIDKPNSNRLGSWVGGDCCSWKGVECHNVTGNVITLDLQSELQSEDREVNPTLLELKYLKYLGNLTDLAVLDLSTGGWEFKYEINNLEWAFGLKKLQYLDLSGIKLTQARQSLSLLLHHLPSLSVLDLAFCGLGNSHTITTTRNSTISYSPLQHLDLSGNLFSGPIPHFLQNMSSIRYLDLSYNYFNDSFPLFLQNSSSLTRLDLSNNQFSSSVPSWLANKTYQLEYLDLSGNHFNRVDGGILGIIGHLCKLRHLDLSDNQFQEEVVESHVNFSRCSVYDLEDLSMRDYKIKSYFPIVLGSFSSLTFLDLSYTDLEGLPPFFERLSSLEHLILSNNNLSIVAPVIGSLSSLTYLDLSYNNLRVVPSLIANLSSLQTLVLSNNYLKTLSPSLGRLASLPYLDLSYNSFRVVSSSIGNWSSLQSLDLSNNNVETLTPSLGRLSSLCFDLNLSYNNLRVVSSSIGNWSSLQTLDLSNNNLETLAPSLGRLSSLSYLGLSYNNLRVVSSSIGNLSSLQTLDLSNNNLETLPPFLERLSSLSSLDLSSNNLSVVYQVSLANLSSLMSLDISSNSAFLDLSPDWIPPFQLMNLEILPCKLNSPFPDWILSQKLLSDLDLSNTGISGPLPDNIGIAMPHLSILRLASNHINGSIPRSLCKVAPLYSLHLQNNSLSGIIPDCWEANSTIQFVDLSSNKLSGPIPTSLTKATLLYSLTLSNNSIEGELPLSWTNSTKLTHLDLSGNDLHGKIPPWNGVNFPSLQVLILRENNFSGRIPPQLCSIQTLHIINLANNNFVGTIPQCFGSFKSMGSMLHANASISFKSMGSSASTAQPPSSDLSALEVVKGQDREYTTILDKLVNMDLSCNHLVGVIPTEIANLSLLNNLNLSHNHLTGNMPMEIGKMTSLESLDLSSNNLSGSIPASIISLDFLSNLNLSFNNLHGPIPTGRHLETLDDPSIYMGNMGLCGGPLIRQCSRGDSGAHPPTSTILEVEEDNKHEKMWFYMVIMLGFATGFWGVVGILVVHKRWRHAYFGIAEELADWIYVRVAVMINARANN